MDPIEEYFKTDNPPRETTACLDEAAIAALAGGDEGPGGDEAIAHARDCPSCAQKIALTRRALGAFPEQAVPRKLERRVFSRLGLSRRGPGSSIVWFLLFAVFMALSFVWKPYFLQMLVCAAVAGGKWLLEARARHLYVNVTHQGKADGESPRGRLSQAGESREAPPPSGRL